jgi:hypothetical protein
MAVVAGSTLARTNISRFSVPADDHPSVLLDVLLANPSRADGVDDPQTLRAMQGELAARQIKLASLLALLTAIRPEHRERTLDRMLTPEQAAECLGTRVEWVYKNWKEKLPFGVRCRESSLGFQSGGSKSISL